MDNLVERLRNRPDHGKVRCVYCDAIDNEAADRIEQQEDRIEALEDENNRLIRGHVRNNPHVNGQASEQLSDQWRERLGIFR